MMRRTLLGMLGSLVGAPLTGDGLVRPQNAPPAGQLQPGVQPGTTPGIITTNRVVVFGPGGGVFLYSGTPALGNPPIGWASAAATDPFGNALITAGIGEQDGTGYAVLHGAQLLVNFAGQAVNLSGTVYSPNPGEMDILGAVQSVADVQPFLALLSKLANGGIGPVLQFQNGTAIQCTGGTLTNRTVITTDTLTDMSAGLLNGWAVHAGQAARIELAPDRWVHVIADLDTGTLAGGTNVFTVPAALQPAGSPELPCWLITSTAAAQPQDPYFTVGAHIQCHNFVANQTRIGINTSYPLD